jgi:hypothetical protein
MPPRKRSAASADAARLKVLAASGDDEAFLDVALSMLESGARLQREAALETLVERPPSGARDSLRALFWELDADGLKRDQAAMQRTLIVRALRPIHDVRDADVGMRASETVEIMVGQDVTWQLRVHGLWLLAELAPDIFPYYAVEHLDDMPPAGDGQPAKTAFQLLAGREDFVPIYQWLRGTGGDSPLLPAVIELFTAAPQPVVQRFVDGAIELAMRRDDEPTCIALVETIVDLELEPAYVAIERLLDAKISEQLFDYVAMTLARTNRASLLARLERQLHQGRRPKATLAALQVRTTPEQQAIIDRWERDEAPPGRGTRA